MSMRWRISDEAWDAAAKASKRKSDLGPQLAHVCIVVAVMAFVLAVVGTPVYVAAHFVIKHQSLFTAPVLVLEDSSMFAWMELQPSGGFWSRPDLVGTTEEEVAAIQEGRLSEERAKTFGLAMVDAARVLYCRGIEGRC